jgi:hypothetical protein
MLFRQPVHQEIKSALSALGANFLTPGRPARYQTRVGQQLDDLLIRTIFKQADGRLIPVQPALGRSACKNLKLFFSRQIIIPKKTKSFVHGLDYRPDSG